jgi:spore coat polysaccharide biosynthesis protein SpsF
MSHRFTLDYPDDYAFVAAAYQALYTREQPVFPLEAILALLEERPELLRINARYVGVNWYREHLEALRTIDASATRPAPAELSAARR